MTILDWPESERPREKLLQRGAAALSDAELLAIFLRTGVRGSTAVDLARTLIRQFGGLRSLLAADQTEFCATHGLGGAKYAQLQAVLEMARRHFSEQLLRGDALSSPQAAGDYLRMQLRDRNREIFAAVFLDSQHRTVAYQELAEGTIDGAAVYPREVVKAALRHNAVAVILAHNHPSGVAEPSAADRALTQRLQQALATIDVRVLDHLVVGDGPPTSFAERGWI
ncbi:JAB domain-containing protein [Sinimarinibacterium sp. CAU 1509]|uniref:RadC family protein n=1 Tax=Sinimarinibacterium sp. CAU 1509 TaxID=2562283 RepID=UPI0010AB5C54|nr:DNA repair protein RadC [Sinimarinibacterium sp. CAU 1509]TJY58809.1 JAB domain-containing protein [Sinimarinibacterium sp. CAU 1509]